MAKGYKSLKKKKVRSVGIYLENVKEGLKCNYAIARNTAEAIVMGDYKFDDYKTDKKKDFLKEVMLILDGVDDEFKTV